MHSGILTLAILISLAFCGWLVADAQTNPFLRVTDHHYSMMTDAIPMVTQTVIPASGATHTRTPSEQSNTQVLTPAVAPARTAIAELTSPSTGTSNKVPTQIQKTKPSKTAKSATLDPITNPQARPQGRYREVTALVTGYCPCRKCCGHGSPGRTSTGTSAWTHGAATDPKAVPYGKRIYVPNYGWTKVDDTGGAMRQSWKHRGRIQIDVRFTYHREARIWGRRVMTVLVEE